MNEKLLQEYIQRVGIVTRDDLLQQAGAAGGLVLAPLVTLLENRDVFYSRMEHGNETFLSRDFMFCLHAARPEPALSAEAQDLFDTLSDNEFSSLETLFSLAKMNRQVFDAALRELQMQNQLSPIQLKPGGGRNQQISNMDLEWEAGFLWITADSWFTGLYKPSRYKNLDYSLAELRRKLKPYFSTREINDYIYTYK